MKTSNPYNVQLSATSVDTCLWHIQREIMQRHGAAFADRAMSPLRYYINTGRASALFLRLLINARPVIVARDLAKGGSDSEVIDRICKRIGYNREEVC